jgi:hypothetical protein
MKFWSAILVIAALTAGGCDRRLEPFVPGEKAQAPDLTKIFPAGADRPAEPAAGMPSAGGRGAAPVEESGAPIDGTIELAPELAGRVPPNAVVFLMARREDGGPLVAAQRIVDPRFPLDFSLGSEHRMGAANSFAGPLHISVRVDADGNATTRNVGDLLGSSAEAHEPGDRGVVVLVSEVQAADSAAGASPAVATGATSAVIEMESAAGAPPAAATSAAIEGMLELAPDLAGRVPPGAVLFVIARTAPSGPPLAVVRVATPTFPAKFSIGPEDRMIQSMPFAGEIRISARIDADGNAMTRDPGDLHGAVENPNAPGDRGVALLIDEVL